jgi:hypothetical protein
MPQPQPFTLKVQEGTVPALSAAFQTAARRMDTALRQLRRDGALSESWLGDAVSQTMAAHYNAVTFGGKNSAFAVLTQYQQELQRIADSLAATHRDYGTTEATNEGQFKG